MRTRELLPNYMKEPAWLDLADAIDSVFGQSIKPAMRALQFIRFLYILNPTALAKIEAQEMLAPSDLDSPDRQTAVKQSNLLGLRLTKPAGLSQTDFVNLTRNLGSFWYSKGAFDFIDFIGYCLNCQIEMTNLWTSDYLTFVPEGDPSIGATIWDPVPGPWYPTTHVSIQWDAGKFSVPLVNVVSLFNDVSNYNLVLQSIQASVWMWMDHKGAPVVQFPTSSPADIVAMGLTYKTVVNIKNY